MPEFGQRLGGLDAEAMQVEIVLVFVLGLEEFVGQLRGFVADRHELDAEDVVLA